MKTELKLKIEHVAIGDLHPDPANPRRISETELESLTRSITEFGLVDPIIAPQGGRDGDCRPPAPPGCSAARLQDGACDGGRSIHFGKTLLDGTVLPSKSCARKFRAENREPLDG